MVVFSTHTYKIEEYPEINTWAELSPNELMDLRANLQEKMYLLRNNKSGFMILKEQIEYIDSLLFSQPEK